ncbi:DUF6249 domain-containing protein [uncultured Bacteroides sp.]|uniref:DUF6249 domain-containing protein n=1 Tax=uncultured Bacteroides sp. TaxID=162156 RepID=UPI0025D09907|nr:DUF6249 domain-containing protein [uncultured Bacteroides sp.]
MKNFLLALMVVLTTCTSAIAQNDTLVAQPTVADTDTTALTTIGTEATETDFAGDNDNNRNANDNTRSLLSQLIDNINGGILIAVISIITVFGFPVFVLFIIFFFRYKSRKARYRLVEQALATGQPLPEEFIRESKFIDQRSQGIKNTFTGIGLFIFLWAITGDFGIGTIGLLVTFMGLGQWMIGRSQGESYKDKNGANE